MSLLTSTMNARLIFLHKKIMHNRLFMYKERKRERERESEREREREKERETKTEHS